MSAAGVGGTARSGKGSVVVESAESATATEKAAMSGNTSLSSTGTSGVSTATKVGDGAGSTGETVTSKASAAAVAEKATDGRREDEGKDDAGSESSVDGDDDGSHDKSDSGVEENQGAEGTGEAGGDDSPGSGVAAGGGWRVKLYQLNEKGQWDDRGTGHISCRFVESLGGTALVVLAEDDGRELMQSKVVDEDVYQRQGDNIITWCEAPPLIGAANGAGAGGGGVDLALSFQENVGCLEIWDQICDVQGRFGNEYGRGARGGGEAAVPLPEPKMDTLAAIWDVLKRAGPQAKETYAGSLSEKSGEYVGKLLKVFNDCEDLDDDESLGLLCHIFKAIVGLNDGTLLEVLLADELFVDMAGVFEYDLELKEKGEHRKFLTQTASFKQVLPIRDEEVVQKIHQNFRVTFLKDALLRPMMDDAVVGTLNALTYFNNTEIIQSLQRTEYVRDVFLLLNKPETGKGGAKRRDILMFLRELFNMAKTLQVPPRDSFYRHLWDEVPLFEVFVPVLKDSQATVAERTACMEVLLASLAHDPALFRTHILKQGGHPPLPPDVNNQVKGSAGTKQRGVISAAIGGGGMGGAGGGSQCASSVSECRALFFWILRRLTTDQDTGVLLQAAEICRMALDTETMEGQPDRDTFLGVFYEHYVHWLVEPFWAGDVAEASGGSNGEALSQGGGAGMGGGETRAAMLQVSRGHICDLLSFCVRSHTFRMKYFVLRNNVVSRVLRLLSCKDKYLQLSAIRFLRSCVGIKDEFYNRYLVKNNLLAPVFALFRENRGRDNLINSAVIELVEFISMENVKSLVEHVVERFSSSFPEISQKSILEAIKLKHDQNLDMQENRDRDFGTGQDDGGILRGMGGRGSRAAQNRRKMAEEDGDEAYFNGSDDDDEEDDNSNNDGPQPVAMDGHGGDGDIGLEQSNGGVVGGLKLVAYGDEDDSDEDVGGNSLGSLQGAGKENEEQDTDPSSSSAASSNSVTRASSDSGATPMIVAGVVEKEGDGDERSDNKRAAAEAPKSAMSHSPGGEADDGEHGIGRERVTSPAANGVVPGTGGTETQTRPDANAAEMGAKPGQERGSMEVGSAEAAAVEDKGGETPSNGSEQAHTAGDQQQQQGQQATSSGGEPDPKRLRLST